MKTDTPIIVVKRPGPPKKIEAGSAWKIAYADFVTAMMAFFLLMWLLGSTTQGDLKGISEYFKNPLKVTMFGGPSSGNSSNPIPGGGSSVNETFGQEQKGDSDRKQIRQAAEKALADAARQAEYNKLQNLQGDINAMVNSDPRFNSIKTQVKMALVDDGLEIQLIDQEGRPMFNPGSAQPRDYLVEILSVMSSMLNEVPNMLTVTGHTDSQGYSGGDLGYSNWELSSERANAARLTLMKAGLKQGKILKVSGLADKVPYHEDPFHASNRRISIVVLNKEAEDEILKRSYEAPVPKKIDFNQPTPVDLYKEQQKNRMSATATDVMEKPDRVEPLKESPSVDSPKEKKPWM